MPFLQLTIRRSAPPIRRRFEDALLAAGAASITLEDAGDDPVLEPPPGTTPLWPRVRIKALFDADRASRDAVLALRCELGDSAAGRDVRDDSPIAPGSANG